MRFGKIFSVGINPSWSLPESCYLLDTYQGMLDSIYFTPPFASKTGAPYGTMRPAEQEARKDSELKDKITKLASYAKKLDIRTDLVVNHVDPKEEDFEVFYEYADEIDADDITCLPIHKEFFIKKNDKRKHIYSFNAKKPEQKEYEDSFYDSYVLDSQYLWERNLRPLGKESRILTNSGCPKKCAGCMTWKHEGNACRELFNKEWSELGPEMYIAYHCLFPRDIELYLENFKDEKFVFKIGSRLNPFWSVERYLQSFDEGYSIAKYFTDFNEKYIQIVFRYVGVTNAAKGVQINTKKITESKNILWSRALGKEADYFG